MTNLFEFSSSKRHFAVIGNPVAHSRSPEIHQMFGRQCGITLEYDAVQVDPGGLPQAVRNLQARGFGGREAGNCSTAGGNGAADAGI